jgi:dTDP-4-amino-4,6-dideoxygalactose transaminase
MIPRYAPNFSLTDLWHAALTSAAPGPGCVELAARIGAATGCAEVVLAPSGRGALRLILLALPAGRVVVPAYTCSAVVEAARLAGREVVTVDHAAGGINLQPSDVEGLLRPGDVLIATHQYGYPCDVEGLLTVARAAGAVVVEDLAAGLGGRYEGRPFGSLGLVGFGSLDPSKLVHTVPKGGFACTQEAALASRLRQVAARESRLPGRVRKAAVLLSAAVLRIGTRRVLYRLFYFFNFTLRGRLTAEDGVLADAPNAFYSQAFAEWQAAVALPQMRRLPELIARRAAIHATYRAEIRAGGALDIEGSRAEVPGAAIRFPVYSRSDKAALHRRLAARGVDTGFSFTSLAAPPEAARAWRIAGRVLNLPIFVGMTEAEVSRVVAAVGEEAARAEAPGAGRARA